jgi:Rad3-related DNA helicase
MLFTGRALRALVVVVVPFQMPAQRRRRQLRPTLQKLAGQPFAGPL